MYPVNITQTKKEQLQAVQQAKAKFAAGASFEDKTIYQEDLTTHLWIIVMMQYYLSETTTSDKQV